MTLGKVALVGAGPHDPGLLTLRGKHLLETADVVVYDALVSLGVRGLIPPETRCINVGKRAGNHPVPQAEICEILCREAEAGNLVVRLKGGDPFLFGRGGEELEALAVREIPFEVVPGVSSAIAAPAYAGIPVTHRDFCSSVQIITAHTRADGTSAADYAARVQAGGTLVFLMGASAVEEICTRLIAAGMPEHTPAAIVERGTAADQRTLTAPLSELAELAREREVGSPAVIVVGGVCSLAGRLAWTEKRPLGGKRVLVTRPRERAGRFTQMLRDAGAEVIELPCIGVKTIEPNPALDRALAEMGRYAWLVFTSPSGVRLFFERMREREQDIRAIGVVRLAAIGSATAAELRTYGLMPALVPTHYSAAALGEALADVCQLGERILIARAREGSPDLTAALNQAGWMYDDLALYETHCLTEAADEVGAMLRAGKLDYLAFTSASTVRGFAKLFSAEDCRGRLAICIGESTAAEAKAAGMRAMVAREATLESMLELMETHKEEA